jgi:hypothetical protein
MNDAMAVQILDDINKLSDIKLTRFFCELVIFYQRFQMAIGTIF